MFARRDLGDPTAPLTLPGRARAEREGVPGHRQSCPPWCFAQAAESGEPLSRLLPGEAYESVDEIPLRLPAQLPAPVSVLMQLARVDSPWHMSDEGPLHAATVDDSNADEPALRLFECETPYF